MSLTVKAPTIRFHDLFSCCVKTIEAANIRGFSTAFCMTCGATLKADGHAWEFEKRAPVRENQSRDTEIP
jgi:hypothetical protein